MRFILLFTIKIYWKLIPEYRRRTCLFSESCSNYVFRITKTEGFLEGLNAFKSRYNKCRRGYKICNLEDGGIELHLVDGTILKGEEISCTINPDK